MKREEEASEGFFAARATFGEERRRRRRRLHKIFSRPSPPLLLLLRERVNLCSVLVRGGRAPLQRSQSRPPISWQSPQQRRRQQQQPSPSFTHPQIVVEAEGSLLSHSLPGKGMPRLTKGAGKKKNRQHQQPKEDEDGPNGHRHTLEEKLMTRLARFCSRIF